MFYTLAQAVCSCMTAVPAWREAKMSGMLDSLFNIPASWKRENIAGFLLFCSEKLILEYLRRKLNRRTEAMFLEVGRLLVDMIIISHRFDNELSANRGIGKIFNKVCEYPSSAGDRARLGVAVWRVISTEIEERSMEMDEEDLLEVLHAFGCQITNNAFIEKAKEAAERAKEVAQDDMEE